MPDLEISKLPVLAGAGLQTVDEFPLADKSASETKKITAEDLAEASIRLLPAGAIPATKLDLTSFPDGSIDGSAVTANTLPADRIVAGSITAVQLGPDSVGASELAANAVDTAAIQNLAVTGAKIANDTITAVQIAPNSIGASELANGAVDTLAILDASVTGVKIAADTITAVNIAPNAIGAGELANGAVDNAALLDGAVTGAKIFSDTITATQIAPNAITSAELANGSVDTFALLDGNVTNAKLAGGITSDKITSVAATAVTGTLTTAQLADAAVTAAKLADLSVDTAAIQDASVTNVKLANGIDGAKLLANTVDASKILATSLDRGLDKTTGDIGHTNAVSPGTRSGITFDAQGHITGTAALKPADLPVATTSATGVVSVPGSSGLTVSGVGALGHANTVTAGSRSGVSYDAHGHITGIVALTGSDLPAATATTLGGVTVPGPSLTVSGTGALTHNDSGVAPGTYTKTTVDAKGHVIAGTLLAAADIPELDAAKITSGSLSIALLPYQGITQDKLADYSVAFIQEASPPSVNDYHNGMLWFQESTGQLRMWNGNSWFPVGFGRLSAENLRYCGTFDAATGIITGVTQFGTTEGFSIGDVIPSATDAKSGVYFVCTTPGNGTPVATGITFDAGDWILCNGLTAGWVRVDTLSGAGGGGASNLGNLLDVTLTAPSAGDLLVLGTGGQWVNLAPANASTTTAGQIRLATQAEVDAGTDALKAVTSKTLQDAVLDGGSF